MLITRRKFALLSAFLLFVAGIRRYLNTDRIKQATPTNQETSFPASPTSVVQIEAFSGFLFTVSILNTFHYTLKACQNCLPNYFTTTNAKKRNYRRGVAVFIHHQKGGGTTVRKCLYDLIGSPDRLLTKQGSQIHGSRCLGSMHTDSRLFWIYKMTSKQRSRYSFIEGPNSMGICDDIRDRDCSYFSVLREPVSRVVSSYFYCKREPSDLLCASQQLSAQKATLRAWAVHQRHYLLTQLTFNVRYCNLSREEQQQLPCWYRQRHLMEQRNDALERLADLVVNDLESRFAVIGILEHFEESLAMMAQVYGLDFLACAGRKENPGTSASKQLEELKTDSVVLESTKFDRAIYMKAYKIFLRQKDKMLNRKNSGS
eukprot:m.311328 g.311328  ORF g.311328 m.311328 type:complete len:372 (+) comp65414_c0_seq1:24-1139(+)